MTITDSHTEPPPPVHSRVKLVVPFRTPVASSPLVGLLPLQPSRAVQLVALVDDQLSVELSPAWTEIGFAVSVSVGSGAGGADTVTVTFLETLPPSPTQSSV